ncbi:MAG: ArsR/SmtB family transcription factor [Pseudonocardiaceae bacterium]
MTGYVERVNCVAPTGAAAEGEQGTGCCEAPTVPPLSQEDAERLETMLKALANASRLRLLSLIQASEGGETCACDLIVPVGLTQPTVSHHLKVLTEVGLLTREKRGVWAYYRIAPERMNILSNLLHWPAPVTVAS